MMKSPDYYAEAQGIATMMFERGEFEWSARIENVILNGFTATEILMGLRFTFQELLQAGAASPEENAAAEKLIDQLNRVV